MQDPSVKDTVIVLQIPIVTSAKKDVLQLCRKHLQEKNALSCMTIVTPNPEIIMLAQKDKSLLTALKEASLQLADGIGIILAIRFLFGKKIIRMTGVDTMFDLCQMAASLQVPVFLFGAKEGVAGRCAKNLIEKIPTLKVTGVYAGNPGDAVHALPVAIKQKIQISRIIFVAYGAPKQEVWIQKNKNSLAPNSIVMTVGGAFDFYAGDIPRAPRLIRKIGLEWAYRLIRQPWRWKRMLVLPQFCLKVIASKIEKT